MIILRAIRRFCKVLLAGIVAVAILSVLLCAYAILPIRAQNTNGNTDYVRESNAVWVKMMEGTSFGRFDANGYNNAEVVDAPQILITGSSHMEATNVMQNLNAAYLLGEKLKGRYSVYNVGMARHNLLRTCGYIEKNMQLYADSLKLLVVETSTVEVTQEMVDMIVNGEVWQKTVYDTGILALLQKLPFFNQSYKQLEGGLWNMLMGRGNTAEADDAQETAGSSTTDAAAYDELFAYMASLEEKYGVQILIFYHPTGELQEDGSISFADSTQKQLFGEYAQAHDINFVDMTSAFEEMYYSEHHVAHGFANGKLESGHLNEYGHAAIADALYDEINAMEEAGLICP